MRPLMKHYKMLDNNHYTMAGDSKSPLQDGGRGSYLSSPVKT
jgi:hypothetical protein